jgi:hypothetical protein
MTINTNALSSTFRPLSPKDKTIQAEYRRWQAVFFTLRFLVWEESKGKVFKDAINDGSIEPIAPGVRLADGSYSRPEYDQDDIKDLYQTAQKEFNEEFDKAFIKGTIQELADYATKYFGKSLQDLLDLNAERSASRFNRG